MAMPTSSDLPSPADYVADDSPLVTVDACCEPNVPPDEEMRDPRLDYIFFDEKAERIADDLDQKQDREERGRDRKHRNEQRRAKVAADQIAALKSAQEALAESSRLMTIAPDDFDWTMFESAEAQAEAREKARARAWRQLHIASKKAEERQQLLLEHWSDFLGQPLSRVTKKVTVKIRPRGGPPHGPPFACQPDYCDGEEPCHFRPDGRFMCWCPSSPGHSSFEEAYVSDDITGITGAAAPSAAPSAVYVVPKTKRKRSECRRCGLPMSGHTRNKMRRWICPVSDTYPQHYDF